MRLLLTARSLSLVMIALPLLPTRAGAADPAAAQAVAPPAARPAAILFRGVRVFDGDKLSADQDVRVEGGKVAAVGRKLDARGATIVDGKDRTLLPGLIDCHTHSFAPDALRQALLFGVTTELEMMGDPAQAAIARKRESDGENFDQADLRSSGFAATATGGHGTEYGMVVPTVDRPDQAKAFVDARFAEGSDYLKIIIDDGSSYGIHFNTLDAATLKALVAAAHEHKKLAVAHIGTMADAREAIDAGVDGLVHLHSDGARDPEFGQFARAHKVFVVPTLSVLESVTRGGGGQKVMADAALAPYLDAGGRSSLDRSFKLKAGGPEKYEAAEAALKSLRAAGVPVLAGTDAPNPGTTHGASLHRELELLVAGGLTPIEALRAATSLPSVAFRLPDRGRIAPGQLADLVLVAGDPTKDILATRNIVGVWKRGHAVDRDAWKKSVADAAAAEKARPQAAEPQGLGTGLVSDFETGETSARFGAGWAVSTDSMRGGKSTATIAVAAGGAQGSKGALAVQGEIAGGLPYAWAGAIFFPGATPLAPADLSSRGAIAFSAKGDGKSYRLMLFTGKNGPMPSIKPFVAGPEWQSYTFPLAEFSGSDGSDVTGVFFGGGPDPGAFAFSIDDVRFERKP